MLAGDQVDALFPVVARAATAITAVAPAASRENTNMELTLPLRAAVKVRYPSTVPYGPQVVFF